MLARQEEFREGLPYLYGHKWYFWQRQFKQSMNNFRFMNCANQVGKSVCHQWDKIDRATNVALQEKLWPGRKPDLFWYWMTDQDTLDREFRLKWKRWLPQGDFKTSKEYGWTLDANKKEEEIKGVHFKSGIYLEFPLFTQSPKNVQSATVWDMGFDEEMPVAFWDEAIQRISSTGMYCSGAFTATLGQQFWWRVMEGQGESELLPDAFKLHVSKFDCLLFDDGSPGLYTEEQIRKQIAMCSSQAQIDRRIFGRFATETGRKYHTFDPAKHYIEPRPIPSDWVKYSGIDSGAGGEKNHPGAFYFAAVRPDNRLGYIYKGRRLDGIETTAGDVYSHYVTERGQDIVLGEKYDYHAKDLGLIAERNGESFIMADKSHSRGEEVINTLFANNMLLLFDTPEVRKVGDELLTVMSGTDKRAAKDDAVDSVRYCVVDIPWDWTAIQGKPPDGVEREPEKAKPLTKEEYLAEEIRQRRGDPEKVEEDWGELADDVAFWNEQIGSD